MGSVTPSSQLCLVSSILGFVLHLVRQRKPGGTAVSVCILKWESVSESQSRCFEMQLSRFCSNTDWKVYWRDSPKADAASPSGLLKALNIHNGFTLVSPCQEVLKGEDDSFPVSED